MTNYAWMMTAGTSLKLGPECLTASRVKSLASFFEGEMDCSTPYLGLLLLFALISHRFNLSKSRLRADSSTQDTSSRNQEPLIMDVNLHKHR